MVSSQCLLKAGCIKPTQEEIPIRFQILLTRMFLTVIATIGFISTPIKTEAQEPVLKVDVGISLTNLYQEPKRVSLEVLPPAPPSPPPVPTPPPAPKPVYRPKLTVNYPHPSDWYKNWIYTEESGNNPTRYNSIGCLGIGQACPASKLLKDCPTMDYDCEDTWFTNYMLARYGSWQNAYYFHIRNGWW